MPTWTTRVNLDIEIKYRGQDKRLTDEKRKLLKRRHVIKPIIVRLKAGHRMDRCHVKKQRVMRYTRVLCAAGLQHALADADDRQERPGPFVVPVAGERFDGHIR
jgi:hypothetical protein